MLSSVTRVAGSPAVTSLLGFPLTNISAKNNNLVVVVKQLKGAVCEVTMDAYAATYQAFKFSSFKVVWRID
jgi:hypothetical protein